MANGRIHNFLPYGLGIALLATAVHLGWEVTHGGVKSHHLLARSDLPAISNWWGLLILPLLGWFASHSVTRRAQADESVAVKAIAGFSGALLVGVALSVSFATGYESVSSGVFLATVASGLVLPTYQAEYAFGFVLGMTFVIGSALPMIAASVLAAISATAHLLIRPAFALLFRKVRA